MKEFRMLLIAAMAVSNTFQVCAQDPKSKGLEAITRQAVQGQLEFLASDWTEGRHTGRSGAYMAADYIASLFKVYGLQPGGDMVTKTISWRERMAGQRPTQYRSFYQEFNLIEYKPGEHHSLSLVNRTTAGTHALNFANGTDFSVQTSDVAIDIEMPVIFAGYGFRDKKSGYDDYKSLDVSGKIVLILNGFPGHKDSASRAFKEFNRDGTRSGRSLRREKNNLASELGVAAVIEVEPGRDAPSAWAENIPFRYHSSGYEGDVPRASFYETRMKIPGEKLAGSPTRLSISERVLNKLLEGSGIDIAAYEESVKQSLKPASRVIPGKLLKIQTSVESRMIRARNVVGVLPGKDTSEIIVVGGHFDHLGKHDGWIWNGADDNASGTVGVMTLAKACMAAGQVPEKTIVFAAWTGEEKGLLGSTYFADHPYNDARMILNLNYDMISRDNRNDTLGVKCSMTYTRKYRVLEKLSNQNNEAYGLGLDISFRPSDRPRGGSDHTPFAAKDIPVFYFMAGFPPEYHQPGDHTDLVNWDKMVNIIKIGYLNIWDLANKEWGPEPVD